MTPHGDKGKLMFTPFQPPIVTHHSFEACCPCHATWSSILIFQLEVFIMVFCSTWVSHCVAFHGHFFLISNMRFSIGVHHGILFLVRHLLWFFHDHLFLLFSPRSLVFIVISTQSTHHYALHGFLFLLSNLKSLHWHFIVFYLFILA